ncbi:MAG: PKD domain-containing protein [Halobacteriales archaeon]|nr:PKD domain-containing protein [Halobacteriales archaeon]
MDKVFPSNSIKSGGDGNVWELDKAEQSVHLPETYTYNGEKSVEDYINRTGTTGIVVAHDGTILNETYYRGYNASSKATSWSVAKSFTSALTMRAVENESIDLSLEDNVTEYLPELEGSGYEDAKVKHVLTMSSGADGTHFGRTDADYRNVSIPSRAYFNNESLLEQFSGYDSQFEPGTDQNYINSDTAVLGLVLEEVTGQPLNRYLEDEIWKPVGMEADTFWSTDNEGNNIGMCCLNAQLRDYTRFGRLYLNDGRRTDTGEQIIPANLVNESTQPQGSGIGGVGYGYSWWVPSEDEFAAIGLNGQYIYVNESKDVVVTKTSTDVGLTTDREHIEFFRAVSTLEGEEPKNASFAVNITDTNSPVEGETLSVDVRVENTGDENDTQTVTLDVGTLGNSSTNVTLPGGSSATGTLTLGTSAGDAGEYTATVFSDDDSDARSVTVNDAQTAPTIDTNTGSSVDEGASDTITQSELETTDAEQGPSSLTYTIDADVSEGLLFNTNTSTQLEQGDSFTQQDINDDFIEYRHDGTEPTSESFDFTVRDGAGGSVSGNFSITINQVNDAPTANDDDITPSPAPTEDDDLTASTAYGGIDVIGNDDSRSGVNIDSDVDDPISALSIESITTGQGTETAENTPLTLVDTTQGFNNQEIRFHVSFSGQEVTVAEQSNLDALPGGTTGTFSFDYTVQDDDGDTGNGSTATVTFKVTGVNDAPTANDDFASTDQDTSVTVDVVANDADVDDGQSQLDVTAITNGPSHGTAQITGTSNDKIEFTPGSGATSDVQITYEVSDDNGDTDTATLSMTVNETGIFGVNVTGTNSPVTEGDALEVMANVTNTGGESGTRTITLDVPGLGTDSTTVSLPGGASTTETLTLGTDSGDAGTYTATVESENDTDTTEVVVDEPANFAVSLTATNSPVTEGETLTVDADIRNTGDAQGTQTVGLNAETLGNDSTSVTLTGGANTTVTLSVGTGAGDAGSYTATVSSDNDTASTTVEVQEPQQPPNFAVSIDATNSPVTEGDTLEVTANVTNTGDEPDTQEVSLTDFDGVEQDSISVTLGSGEFNTITLNWSTSEGDNGTGDVTVSTENDTDTANVTVEPVAEPNTPPVANFTLTPGIPSTADTVEFDASSSDDPDGSVSDYGWDFGDGNGDTGRNVTHSYSDNGTFTVTLTVTDDDGATNSTNETVTVSNVPPSADFVFSPNTPTPSDTVSFDSSPSLGSSTDPDGSIVEYEWDFGDGSTEKGETAEHSYDNPGSFTVTLSVTDDDGSTVNTTQGVTVEEETFEEEEGCVNRREVGRGNEDRACPSDEGTQRRDRGRGQEDGETNERRGSSRGSGSRDTDRRRDRGR